MIPMLSLQGAAAILSNLLTLICVFKYKYLRTSPHILIGSLALNDFLHGFSILLRAVHKSLCLTGYTIDMITTAIQFMTYSLMAFERRQSLHSLLHNKTKWTIKKTLVLVLISWALGIVCVVTMIQIAEIPPGVACEELDRYLPKWYINIFLGFTIFASLLTVINYGSIGLMICSSNHQVTSHMPFTMQQLQRRKSNIRIAKMVAMVFGVFFALYCPVSVTLVLIDAASPAWFRVLYYISPIIYQTNFWINPFIYARRDEKFKKAFKMLLPGCFCSNAVGPGPMVNHIEMN